MKEKEKRYIVLEVEVETEYDSVEECNVLKDDEWERHSKFSDMLYENTYGYVTRVSMLLRKDPRT